MFTFQLLPTPLTQLRVAKRQARLLLASSLKGKGARSVPEGKKGATEAAPTMRSPPARYFEPTLSKDQIWQRERVPCVNCKALIRQGDKSKHMAFCTGSKHYKCKQKGCGKAYAQSGDLVVHMRKHTGEKPYECKQKGCGKAFPQSCDLVVHTRTHTGEKPYKCKKCGRGFSQSNSAKICKCTGRK